LNHRRAIEKEKSYPVMVKRDIIVMGASAGGLQALSALLVRSLILFPSREPNYNIAPLPSFMSLMNAGKLDMPTARRCVCLLKLHIVFERSDL
jgi:hypothetical protein